MSSAGRTKRGGASLAGLGQRPPPASSARWAQPKVSAVRRSITAAPPRETAQQRLDGLAGRLRLAQVAGAACQVVEPHHAPGAQVDQGRIGDLDAARNASPSIASATIAALRPPLA